MSVDAELTHVTARVLQWVAAKGNQASATCADARLQQTEGGKEGREEAEREAV